MVIPEVTRKKVLEQLHQAHICIEKTKWRARETFFGHKLTNQKYDKEVQHLSTKLEETAT